jgi:hypothetical protein
MVKGKNFPINAAIFVFLSICQYKPINQGLKFPETSLDSTPIAISSNCVNPDDEPFGNCISPDQWIAYSSDGTQIFSQDCLTLSDWGIIASEGNLEINANYFGPRDTIRRGILLPLSGIDAVSFELEIDHLTTNSSHMPSYISFGVTNSNPSDPTTGAILYYQYFDASKSILLTKIEYPKKEQDYLYNFTYLDQEIKRIRVEVTPISTSVIIDDSFAINNVALNGSKTFWLGYNIPINGSIKATISCFYHENVTGIYTSSTTTQSSLQSANEKPTLTEVIIPQNNVTPPEITAAKISNNGIIIAAIISALALIIGTLLRFFLKDKKKKQNTILKTKNEQIHFGSGNNQIADIIYNISDNAKEKEKKNKVSKLIKIAIDNIVDYGEICERDDKITRDQRREKAFESIDNLKKYFENHIIDFPSETNGIFQNLFAEMEHVMQYKYLCWCGIRDTQQLIEQKVISPEQILEVRDIRKLDKKLYEIQKQILEEFQKPK